MGASLCQAEQPQNEQVLRQKVEVASKNSTSPPPDLSKQGIAKLLASLQSTDENEQERAAADLADLTIDNESESAGLIAKESSAVRALVAVLGKGSVGAQDNAAAAIRHITIIDETIVCNAPGALKSLVALLSASSPDSREHAAAALRSITSRDGWEAALCNEPGALEGLVALLDSGGCEAQEHAAAVLCNSVVDDALRQKYIDTPGLVQSLVLALGSLGGTEQVQEIAVTALYFLCKTDRQDVLRKVREVGAEQSAAFLARVGSEQAQANAQHLLHLLAPG